MDKRELISNLQESAIDGFFSSVERLKELGVIRSSKYLGDIAEFLCTNLFDMTLAESKKQVGHDGIIDGLRCQVKYSGGTSQTVDLGNPGLYDRLIIVLGPDSVLRRSGSSGRWQVFNIPNEVVLRKGPNRDGVRRYTKGQLPMEFFVGEFHSLKEIGSIVR